MTLLRERVARRGIGAIEPCLPSPAKVPPSGRERLREIVETSGRRDRRRRRRKLSAKRGLTVRVVSWNRIGWGVDIDPGNGRHKAYAVGSREAAEAEAERIRSGGRAPTRQQVARLVKGRPRAQ
jgi:hypothetical protein